MTHTYYAEDGKAMTTKMPTVGMIVRCPPDRSDKGFQAKITHVDPTVNKNIHGVLYRWITVERMDGRGGGGVWPSHRLGFHVPKENP